MKQLIAFIGFEGSGKDYQTQKILKDKSYTRIGMSDAIREMAFKIAKIEPIYGEPYENWKQDIAHCDLTNGSWLTGRELLLKVGEGERKKNPYIWSEKWFEKADKIFPNNIVVNDCRFWHEVRAIFRLSQYNGYDVTFYYCRYKSERFKVSNESPDKLAKLLFDCGVSDGENVNNLLKEMVIYKSDTL